MKKIFYVFSASAVFILMLSQCALPEKLHYYIPCRCPRFETYKYSYRMGYFTVRKIYSYDGMYLIYAQKGDSIYKIYSPQEQNIPNDGHKLYLDSTYYLYLRPVYSDLSPISNRIHTALRFERYGLSAKNTDRDYCVFNAYLAKNIIDNFVYDSCFEMEFENLSIKRRMRIIRRQGLVDEPEFELPEEWDDLPRYNNSVSSNTEKQVN